MPIQEQHHPKFGAKVVLEALQGREKGERFGQSIRGSPSDDPSMEAGLA